MTAEKQAIAFSNQGELTFKELQEELFEKYNVQGDKALYALALAFRNTSRIWDVEPAFAELLPLFTETLLFGAEPDNN